MDEAVGVVAELRRFPVKSMQGERIESATVGTPGLLGDRAFAVVDKASGQVVTAKTPHLGPLLLACRASLPAAPGIGPELPPVRIEFPDGTHVCSDTGNADDVLSSYFGRTVRLLSAAPPDSALATIRRDFLRAAGLPAFVEEGSLLDALPVSVLTTSTIDRLRAARPETSFDLRRFRMNVVVATTAPGFVENAWPGRCLQLGHATRLRVAVPVPRCVITTMAQEELPGDPDVLRTVARENRLDIAGRRYSCAGVYAAVEFVGQISAGDVVSLMTE